MKKIITLSIFLLATLAGAYAQNISTGNITITTGGTYTIAGSSTAYTVKVNSGVTANITLSGVNIDVSGTDNACAFDMTGATVNLTLTGTNTLKSGNNKAGLQAPSGSTLVIGGTGSLTAISNSKGAGIGGGNGSAGGTITINGGTVTGNYGMGNSYGAGIGGGFSGGGGTVTITGGTVSAFSSQGGAGIGGGQLGDGGTVTITGGTVTANGSNGGAGIGGGTGGGAGGTITISGGTVTANGSYGAGIGGGNSGGDGTLTMNGNAFVNASSVGDASAKTKGILFNGNTGTMYGNVTLSQNVSISASKTLTVPAAQTLTNEGTLTNGGTITNSGTIYNCNGTIINNGTIDGTGTITCGITHPDANHIVYIKKGSNGDGSSWANAYPELAVALVEAQTNTAIHEIWVAAGTYKPLYKAAATDDSSNPTTDRDKAFVLVEGVKIYGGFPADANDATHINIQTRGLNPLLNATILSGDIDNTPADISGNAYHVVIGANIANDGATVLDGFTVTGGNTGTDSNITVNGLTVYRRYGGGICNYNSSPALVNVTVSRNTTVDGGGGICNYNSSPTLTNVIISGNSAGGGSGGGIDNYNSSPTLTNVTVSGNTANGGSGGSGGGIYNYNSSLTLTNVTVSGNSASAGGGIENNSGTVTLNNTLVWGNNTGVNGAGVYTYNYSLVQGVAASGTNLDGSINPLFVSPVTAGLSTGGDYSLLSGSPAIGAGNNPNYTGGLAALATATDLAGNPRLFGEKIDLGAYEAEVYLATFRFGAPRPDSIAGVASPYLLTEPSPAPERTGYTFGGWYADALYATLFDFTNALTQDTAVYAKWTPVYTVTFERESGLIYETQTVNRGDLATEPSAPDSTGYTFGGWYTSVALTTAFDFAGAITQDSTLHAKWRAKVTFDANPGIITPTDTVVDLGGNVSGWAHVPTRTNHTFGGWYADAALSIPFVPAGAITGDSTVYAKWDIVGYTVTCLRKPGVIHTTQPVLHGSPATAPSAPDSTGYTFGGWYTSSALTTAFNFSGVIMRDSTLHAKWTLIPPPPLEIGSLPLTPGEGTGTPDDPFTGDVTVPIYTENLMTEDIYTGDDTDLITFYADPDCTQPVRGFDLYTGETTTVYIAVQVGNMKFYYAINVTRSDEFTPVIRRSITLPSVAGAVTDPSAGVHLINSGRDFVFTITPTGIEPRSNTQPVVRTGRADTPDDVRITPGAEADGTYTVRIRAIRSDITLSIDLTTANADVATAKVRSYGHTLYIYSTTAGTARIYNLSGQLVKALPHAAGETTQTTLPRGVYIVVVNGRSYKIEN